jgi:hypothetical protein
MPDEQIKTTAIGNWHEHLGTRNDLGWLSRLRWRHVAREVELRKQLVLAAKTDLGAVENSLQLAAADVFVEKAQWFLTQRAFLCVVAGTSCAIILLSVIWGAVEYVVTLPDLPPDWSNAMATYKIMRGSALLALVATAIYFLQKMSLGFFHEAFSSFRTRHALRFVRLCVYLRSGTVDIRELSEAFLSQSLLSGFSELRQEAASSALALLLKKVIPGSEEK